MYTVAIHTISNPEKFWSAAKSPDRAAGPQAPHRLPEHGRRQGRLPLGGRVAGRRQAVRREGARAASPATSTWSIEASNAVGLPR